MAQKKFMIVIVEYFTMWVETKAKPMINEKKVESFIQNVIIYRFGIPLTLVTDNGRQFDNRSFREFHKELQIKLKLTIVTHT